MATETLVAGTGAEIESHPAATPPMVTETLVASTGAEIESPPPTAPLMTTEIFIASTDAEIDACFPVFSALRPHLARADLLPQVRRQQAQSYQILALRDDGVIKSVAGFRRAEFLAWGKVLYIDDLSTLPGETARGFAGALLDWLIEHARSSQCQAVHLDTGYARHAAHRLYLRKGFQFTSHHAALAL